MKSGIYLLTNQINGKRYVGQAKDIRRRWKAYFCPSNLKPSRVSAKAILKYGKDSFKLEVVEYCPIEKLDDREKHYILLLKPEYNMTTGGRGVTGYSLPEEIRERLSEKSKKQWDGMTPEQKQARLGRLKTANQKRVYGRMDDEQKNKVSAGLRRYYSSNTTSELQRKRASEVNRELLKGNCRRKRSVAKICPATGDVIEVFPTVKAAAESISRNATTILGVVAGRRKHAGGYRWEYVVPCSVETIPSGSTVDISTTGSAEYPLKKGNDIVQPMAMVKSWNALVQGIIDLAQRSGKFKTIQVKQVFANDKVEIAYGSNNRGTMVPCLIGDRGEFVGVFAYYQLVDGGEDVLYWPKEQIEAHAKKYSKSWNIKEGKWQAGSAWGDNFEAMAPIPVLKQLLKFAPKSIELARGMLLDGAIHQTADSVSYGDEKTILIDSLTDEVVNTETGEIHDEGAKDGEV